MNELPPSLADWFVELDCFNAALQTAFAPWLPQLAALVGPPRIRRADADGEPEGFDGLTHRGRYERLLLSEWLLADEEPLEFMRRAATGQHLFTALARKTPTQSRCCLVLLDTGPTQLGAPRLAQLALMIVLERRARRSNTRLVWGIVQTPGELHAGFDAARVRKFLAARTLDLHEPGWLDLWTEHLREIGLATDERWLISDGLDALAFGRTTTTISIREQAPEFRQLLVEVRNPLGRQATQSRLLELPDEQVALQILRDPFRAARPATKKQPHKFDPSCMMPPRIWLDPRGRRVFVRTHGGSIAAYHVPPKSTAAAGRARFYQRQRGEHVLAAGMRGKRIMALTYTPERVCLRRHLANGGDLCCGPPADPEVAEALAAAARVPDADGTLVQHGLDRYRYLTPAGVLLELHADAKRKTDLVIVVVAKQVVALSHEPSFFAHEHDGKLWLSVPRNTASLPIEPVDWIDDATLATLAICGVRTSDLRAWEKVDLTREQLLGAVVHHGDPALLTLTERRVLSARVFNEVIVVHRFSHDVIATAFGDHCDLLALLTDNFELHVYSCMQRLHLTRHQLEGPP